MFVVAVFVVSRRRIWAVIACLSLSMSNTNCQKRAENRSSWEQVAKLLKEALSVRETNAEDEDPEVVRQRANQVQLPCCVSCPCLHLPRPLEA